MNHSRSILNPSIVPFLSNWARYTLLSSEYFLACDDVKHPRLVLASKSLVATVIPSFTSIFISASRNYNILLLLTINIDIRYYYITQYLMIIIVSDTNYSY